MGGVETYKACHTKSTIAKVKDCSRSQGALAWEHRAEIPSQPHGGATT